MQHTHLRRVAPAQLILREHVNGQTVGGDVGRRGQKVENAHKREQTREVRGCRPTKKRKQNRKGEWIIAKKKKRRRRRPFLPLSSPPPACAAANAITAAMSASSGTSHDLRRPIDGSLYTSRSGAHSGLSIHGADKKPARERERERKKISNSGGTNHTIKHSQTNSIRRRLGLPHLYTPAAPAISLAAVNTP